MAWLGEIDAFSQRHARAVAELNREVESVLENISELQWNATETAELCVLLNAMLIPSDPELAEDSIAHAGQRGQTFHPAVRGTFTEGVALARIWSIGLYGEGDFLKRVEKKLRGVLVVRAHGMLYEYLMNLGVWFNTDPQDENMCRTWFLRFCCIQLGSDVQPNLDVTASLLLAYHKEFGSKPCNAYSLTANLFPSAAERKGRTWLASRWALQARRTRPQQNNVSSEVSDVMEDYSDTEEAYNQEGVDSDGDVIVNAIHSA